MGGEIREHAFAHVGGVDFDFAAGGAGFLELVDERGPTTAGEVFAAGEFLITGRQAARVADDWRPRGAGTPYQRTNPRRSESGARTRPARLNVNRKTLYRVLALAG